MPPDVDAMAAEVVRLVKGALAPVLVDVKALQAQASGWETRWSDVGALRERVAVLDAKAAQPTDPALGDLRERLAAVETKAAAMEPKAVVPVIAAAEIASEDLAASAKGFTDLLQKELADLGPIRPRLQKRILRADGTELGRVVEEVVS